MSIFYDSAVENTAKMDYIRISRFTVHRNGDLIDQRLLVTYSLW